MTTFLFYTISIAKNGAPQKEHLIKCRSTRWDFVLLIDAKMQDMRFIITYIQYVTQYYLFEQFKIKVLCIYSPIA